MHLVIYGSTDSGKLTVNADSLRVTLTKRADGTWEASSPDAFSTVQRSVARDLGPLLALLFPVDTNQLHVVGGAPVADEPATKKPGKVKP